MQQLAFEFSYKRKLGTRKVGKGSGKIRRDGKPWNDGEAHPSKGKIRKVPIIYHCAVCENFVALPTGSGAARSRRWHAKRGEPVYCSDECAAIGKSRNLSEKLKGHPGYPPSPEGLARRVAANTGRPAWNKGKKYPPEWFEIRSHAMLNSQAAREHLAKIQQEYKGEKSPHWKGGITPINRSARNTREARQWRKAVLKRDKRTCQMCGTKEGIIDADHIKPFSTHPELRFDVTNGRALCRPCHRKTPSWGYRDRRKFQAKMSNA
jgi:HNH endonuclease